MKWLRAAPSTPSKVRKKLGDPALVELENEHLLPLEPVAELGRQPDVLLCGAHRVAATR